MAEAIYGLVGVLLGSGISWFQTYWSKKKDTEKSARYLAIRVVCILDKFMEDCVEVMKDDGLSFGERNSAGFLQEQVEAPDPPVFPEDVDWRSIDSNLMYQLLSFPSEVEDANKLVKASAEIASPPDFDEWFNERKFHYGQLGLTANRLSGKLLVKYGIEKKTYNDWNPADELKKDLAATIELRKKRMEQHTSFVKKVFRKPIVPDDQFSAFGEG